MLRRTFGSLLKSFSQTGQICYRWQNHTCSFTPCLGPLSPGEVASKGLSLTMVKGSSKTLSFESNSSRPEKALKDGSGEVNDSYN